MRRNLIAVLGVTALCVPALAGTAPLYSVTYLPYSKGSLGTYGINAAGHAAGEIDTPGAQAAAWIASGERDLGYLDRPYQYCYQSHAYAINDSDMVVGLQHFVSCAYHTGDLDRAAREQLGRIAHSTFLGQTHAPGALLAEELAAVAPPAGGVD